MKPQANQPTITNTTKFCKEPLWWIEDKIEYEIDFSDVIYLVFYEDSTVIEFDNKLVELFLFTKDHTLAMVETLCAGRQPKKELLNGGEVICKAKAAYAYSVDKPSFGDNSGAISPPPPPQSYNLTLIWHIYLNFRKNFFASGMIENIFEFAIDDIELPIHKTKAD